MSLVGKQAGVSKRAVPGTCDQTGNSAPKYPWSRLPVGKTAKIIALLSARHLGGHDESMAVEQNIPGQNELILVFARTLPWFEAHYNAYRKQAAIEQNYNGPLLPFGPEDVRNRVLYMFAHSGSNGPVRKARMYCISKEHPDHQDQDGPDGLRIVLSRCSKEVVRRMDLGLPVSYEEAEAWGTASGTVFELLAEGSLL